MSSVRSGSADLPLCLALVVVSALSLGASCGDDDDGPAPVFPEDYAATWNEVRDCRSSTEHDFANIRVLADPAAEGPYLDRATPFPEGAVVLKEEYDLGDTACEGEIVRWTVMQRLAAGSAPDTLDWRWQAVGANRRVQSQDESRCIGCHTTCGEPPDGYLGTCAVP